MRQPGVAVEAEGHALIPRARRSFFCQRIGILLQQIPPIRSISNHEAGGKHLRSFDHAVGRIIMAALVAGSLAAAGLQDAGVHAGAGNGIFPYIKIHGPDKQPLPGVLLHEHCHVIALSPRPQRRGFIPHPHVIIIGHQQHFGPPQVPP